MTNVIDFPKNDFIGQLNERSESEEVILKYCITQGEHDPNKIDAILDAAFKVFYEAFGEEETVERLRDYIEFLKILNQRNQ